MNPEDYGVILVNDAQIAKWEKLVRCTIMATRYPSDTATKALGINESMWRLFDRVGWGYIMRSKWTVYPRLVLEFLSTLEVDGSDLRFRLNNEDRELTIDDLNEIYRVPPGGYYIFPEQYNACTFWNSIAKNVGFVNNFFNSTKAKASSIYNPVLRYIQRVMAFSLFGRNDNGGVRTYELFALWCMLIGTNFNLGAFLVDHWEKQSNYDGVPIWIGGLLTPIAVHFNINLSLWNPLLDPDEVDLSCLRNLTFLKSATPPYLFSQRGRGHFPLPNPELKTVTNFYEKNNWKLDTPAHLAALASGTGDEEEEEAPPRKSNRRRRRAPSCEIVHEVEDRRQSDSRRANRANRGTELDFHEELHNLNVRMSGQEVQLHAIQDNMKELRGDMSHMLHMMRQLDTRFPS